MNAKKEQVALTIDRPTAALLLSGLVTFMNEFVVAKSSQDGDIEALLEGVTNRPKVMASCMTMLSGSVSLDEAIAFQERDPIGYAETMKKSLEAMVPLAAALGEVIDIPNLGKMPLDLEVDRG